MDQDEDEHVVAEAHWRQASGAIFITVALAVLMVTLFLAG
jgi:hypothetical protein